jgi:hypothetical protein
MPAGRGRYDAVCTLARRRAKAQGAVVIIFRGEHGDGFSVQGPPALMLGLSEILRQMASEIDASLSQGVGH